MPDDRFLSIITVTLNNADGLEKTATSLAAQSRQDFEWIVMDGKSTDRTTAIAATLPRAPDFFSSHPDDGLYDAMNRAIAHMHGRYALFLNAGDTLESVKTLEKLGKILDAKTPDLLYGDSYEAMPNGKRHYKKARPHKRALLGMFTHHQSILYKASILKTMRFDLNYPIAADYDLTLRFLRQGEKIQYLPRALSVFEAGGLSQKRAGQGRAEQFLIRQKLGLARPLINTAIYLLQLCAWGLRRITPGFYWRLKRPAKSGRSARNTGNGSAPV